MLVQGGKLLPALYFTNASRLDLQTGEEAAWG